MSKQHLEDLKEIRSLMEHSSKFLSLSGLSGVMAGIYACIGAYLGYDHFMSTAAKNRYIPYFFDMPGYYTYYFGIALGVVVLSLITGFYLTARRAKKRGQKLGDKNALRMLFHIGLPLLVGGIMCIAMLYHREESLIASTMLIFYGLGLVSGSKYTLTHIRILGVLEIILGLFAAFFIYNGLLFWVIGFGVLHIVYGAYMWFTEEKQLN
jgi:hypothetical protein